MSERHEPPGPTYGNGCQFYFILTNIYIKIIENIFHIEYQSVILFYLNNSVKIKDIAQNKNKIKT